MCSFLLRSFSPEKAFGSARCWWLCVCDSVGLCAYLLCAGGAVNMEMENYTQVAAAAETHAQLTDAT